MPYPYHMIVLCLENGTCLPQDVIRYIIEYVKYDVLDNQTIHQAVKHYCAYYSRYYEKLRQEATFKYAQIEYWNLSNVTSLRGLFSFINDFNEDISGWNVEN